MAGPAIGPSPAKPIYFPEDFFFPTFQCLRFVQTNNNRWIHTSQTLSSSHPQPPSLYPAPPLMPVAACAPTTARRRSSPAASACPAPAAAAPASSTPRPPLLRAPHRGLPARVLVVPAAGAPSPAGRRSCAARRRRAPGRRRPPLVAGAGEEGGKNLSSTSSKH